MAFESYTVNSSNFQAVEYDPDTLVLRVTFTNGGQYEYEGVLQEVKSASYPLDFGSWLKGEEIDGLYNPNLARQILEQNGWIFNNNKWQKTENYSTKILSFKIIVQASNQRRMTVAEMIKTDLENIGIKVSIVKASDSQYQYYLQNKNYDSIISGTTVSASPNLETYFGSTNYANFNNEELTNLMNEVKNISKEELLEEKFKRIRQIFNEQNPYIVYQTCPI